MGLHLVAHSSDRAADGARLRGALRVFVDYVDSGATRASGCCGGLIDQAMEDNIGAYRSSSLHTTIMHSSSGPLREL